MIQIFTQPGRSTEVGQRVYRTVAKQLEALGIAGEDIFVSFVENGPQDSALAPAPRASCPRVSVVAPR